MQARVRPQLSSRELLWNRKEGLSSRTWRLSGRMDNRESLLSPPLEENKRTVALSEEECLFVPTLLQTRGGERRVPSSDKERKLSIFRPLLIKLTSNVHFSIVCRIFLLILRLYFFRLFRLLLQKRIWKQRDIHEN